MTPAQPVRLEIQHNIVQFARQQLAPCYYGRVVIKKPYHMSALGHRWMLVAHKAYYGLLLLVAQAQQVAENSPLGKTMRVESLTQVQEQ